MRTLLLVLGALLAAGCTDSGGPETATTTAPPVGESDEEETHPSPALPAESLSALNFSYDGTTGVGFCVAPVGGGGPCLQSPIETGSRDNNVREPALEGRTYRVTGNVTWSPSSPLSETLTVSILVRNETASQRPYQMTAASPLTFDWSLEGPPSDEVFLVVRAERKVNTIPIELEYEPSQAFHVEGVAFVEERSEAPP